MTCFVPLLAHLYSHSPLNLTDEDFCCGLQSPDMATNQNARRPHNRGW